MSRATTGRRLSRVGLASSAVAAACTAGLVAAPATAAGNARVNVVHGIPGVAVKICVDGRAMANDVHYGDTMVGTRLSSTTHRVRLVAAGKPCNAMAILTSTYTLKSGHNYTIVASLNSGGRPKLTAFVNAVNPTAAAKARLVVRHTAQAPAVNVWANSTKLVGGKSFTWGSSATLAAPAGTYAVKVTLPGSSKAVIGPVSRTLRQGQAYQYYAVGSPGHYRLVTVKVAVGTR